MPPKIILHIGTHKTGTTSIQYILQSERRHFEQRGYAPIAGLTGKPNFKELFHAAVSRARLQRFALRRPIWPRWYLAHRARRHIKRAMAANRATDFIVSSELLCLLRQRQEIERLKRLFPIGSEFAVVVCLRNKAGYLASLRSQLERQGIPPGGAGETLSDLSENTWLADDKGLLSAYGALTSDLRVIDYDAACAKDADILPSFLGSIGIADWALPVGGVHLNSRLKP
jgi:hypothetical protein